LLFNIPSVYAQVDHLIISEIQITDTDDFIELYNPTSSDIDLAAEDYRIERATQGGGDPSILIRFGNDNDGSFPGGNIISAGSYYLIVRDDVSSDLLNIADAVGTRDDFTLTDSNTIYLGTAAISDKNDPDIVDFVGYNEAIDYEGDSTAPFPAADQSIGRKFNDFYTDTDNNGEDFEIQNPTPKEQNQTYVPSNEPPVADAGTDQTVIINSEVNFDASSSFDPDGEITSYLWDFGDDNTSEEITPVHIYSTVGTYTVTLTVTDDQGDTGSDSCIITVEDLPDYSDKIYINEFLPAPGTSYDWDEDGEANSSDEWIELINLDTEPVDLGNWILDDIDEGGSSPYIIPEDAIIEPDSFLVFYKKDTGIILNNSGDSIILKNPLEEAVDQFSYTSSHTDKSYSRMDNGPGEWTEEYSPSPNALNEPPPNEYPTANAGPDINNAETGVAVNFNGSASYDPDGNIIQYLWNFGDETSGMGENTIHVYSEEGTYQVILTVTDDQGAKDTDSLVVTVVASEGSEEDSEQNNDSNLEGGEQEEYENQYSDKIKIIEFLPNPKGNDAEGEYIKLFNFGPEDINLRNWVLDDEEGGSKSFTIKDNAVISADSEIIFHRTETKIAINNNGDTVRLFDPDGELIDEVSFSETAPEGIAYIYKNGKWGWEDEESLDDVRDKGQEEEIVNDNDSQQDNKAEPELESLIDSDQVQRDIEIIAPQERIVYTDLEEDRPEAGPPRAEKAVVSNYQPVIIVDLGNKAEISSSKEGEKSSNIKNIEATILAPSLEEKSSLNPYIKRPWLLSPYFILPAMILSIIAVIKFIIGTKNLYNFLDGLIPDKKENEMMEKLFNQD